MYFSIFFVGIGFIRPETGLMNQAPMFAFTGERPILRLLS